MRRRWLLVLAAVAVLGSAALLYSLVGAMTGVYAFPSLAEIAAPGNGYLVRRGDDWQGVVIGADGAIAHTAMVQRNEARIESGVWTVTVILSEGGTVYRGSVPWNLADVYALTFGRHRSLGRPAVVP